MARRKIVALAPVFNMNFKTQPRKAGTKAAKVTTIPDIKLPGKLGPALETFIRELTADGGKIIGGQDGGIILANGDHLRWSAHGSKKGANWVGLTKQIAEAAGLPELTVEGDFDSGESIAGTILDPAIYRVCFKPKSDAGHHTRFNAGSVARILLKAAFDGRIDGAKNILKAGTKLEEIRGPKKVNP